MDKQEIRMIHYIFNSSACLVTPWEISTSKSWLTFTKDPFIASRVANLIGAQGIFSFLSRFPQYFQLIPAKSVNLTRCKVKEDAQCPYCLVPAKLHMRHNGSVSIPAAPSPVASEQSVPTQTSLPIPPPTPESLSTSPIAPSSDPSDPTITSSSNAVPSSPPTAPSCSHDDVFRAHYSFFVNTPSKPHILIYQLRQQIQKRLRSPNQDSIWRQIKDMKVSAGDYEAYLSSFACFRISDKAPYVSLKSKFFCDCVNGPNALLPTFLPDTTATAGKKLPVSACGHCDLFRAAFCEISKISPISARKFKIAITSLLRSLNQSQAVEFVESMEKKSFKEHMLAFMPSYLEFNKGKFNQVEGSNCTCKCLAAYSFASSTVPSSSTKSPMSNPTIATTASVPFSLLSTTTSPYVNSEPSTFSTAATPSPSLTHSVHALFDLANNCLTSNNNSSTTHAQLPTFVKKSGSHYYGIIEDWDQCRQAVQYIRNFAQIAVHCEGVNLSKTGKLCLIQIGGVSVEKELFSFVFDIVVLEKTPHFKEVCDCLAIVMQDPQQTKVFHDGRQDCSALFHQLSISVENIFDTQIAYRTLCEAKRGTSSYDPADGKRIGLNSLLQKYSFPVNPFKDTIQARMEKTGSQFWSIRPLSNDLIQYSVHDVAFLIPLMEKLSDDIELWIRRSVKEISYANSRSNIDGPKVISVPAPDRLLELSFTSDYQCIYHVAEQDENTDPQAVEDDFELDEDTLALASLLPSRVRSRVIQKSCEVKRNLVEIVMDHQRPIALRFSDVDDVHLKDEANIPDALKSLAEGIASITGVSAPLCFMSDNRLGISKMLHRVSAIKSRKDEIIGLTYRIGRSVEGVSYMIKDIVSKVAGHGGQKPRSVLLLGRPGVGKTTVLREVASLLSGEFKRRVVIVDTSNEIAGDGDIPHPCIGQARRVQVPHRDEQHSVLIETVQNHNPQVIIVDEIGTSKEVEAVRTITQRGVSMVGTAHGEDLHTLLKNPTLIGLIGGIQQVILSAAEAKNQGRHKDGVYKKTRLERAGAPTFEMVIELRERHKWRIHTNVAEVVDKLLANMDPLVETRKSVGNGKIHSIFSNERAKEDWFEHLTQSTV